MATDAGTTIGPYRIESLLGEGAVGVVYRAVHEDDGTTVALKVLKDRLSSDDTFRRRFVHEARAAQHVMHEYLVPVVDAGDVDGQSYIASAYISGPTLARLLEDEGPMTIKSTLQLVAEVGTALDLLHHEGLIHRDIKPSNLLVDEAGHTRITDFGLAKGPAYTVLTKPGQVMGTLDYLAPELIRGEAASVASDVYALGCVVYECLVGLPPFGRKSIFEVGSAHLNEPPPDPAEARDDMSPSLSWGVLKALEKDPANRPPTATAYASLLHVAART